MNPISLYLGVKGTSIGSTATTTKNEKKNALQRAFDTSSDDLLKPKNENYVGKLLTAPISYHSVSDLYPRSLPFKTVV